MNSLKRRLKRFVLPTLYFLITISIFAGVIILGSDSQYINKDYNYSLDTLEDVTLPTISEDSEVSSEILSPVEEGSAQIGVNFYNRDDESSKQELSLIYYQNTYMPNTGILYVSNDKFNVLSVSSGVIEAINNDEFFGSCVVVKHNDNLKTYYYGLDELEVSVGDEITSSAVLGVSKNNDIMNDKKSFLFEVYYNNELINPESFIGTNIKDYK